VIALLIVAATAAAMHRDEKTGLFLPRQLGDLTFVGIREYNEPSLGYSVRYADDTDAIKADVYLYDLGLKLIPNGIGSREVKAQFEEAQAVVELMGKRGVYRDVVRAAHGRRVLATAIGPQQAWEAHLTYEQLASAQAKVAGAMNSHIIVTGFRNHILKIRFTVVAGAVAVESEQYDRFVADVAHQMHAIADEDMQVAVSAFAAAPLTAESERALHTVVLYAEQQEELAIPELPTLFSWYDAADPLPGSDRLLGAYVVGCAIIYRRNNEAPPTALALAGIRSLLTVYRVLQEHGRVTTVPQLDQLAAMLAAGTLARHIKGLLPAADAGE
jgi:hypothetical protein